MSKTKEEILKGKLIEAMRIQVPNETDDYYRNQIDDWANGIEDIGDEMTEMIYKKQLEALSDYASQEVGEFKERLKAKFREGWFNAELICKDIEKIATQSGSL